MEMRSRVCARNEHQIAALPTGSGALESLPDEALARRVQNGDDEAWGVLYVRSYDYLVAFAESLGRTRDVAEDLAQETLMRAWQHRNRYNPSYPYRGWLRTILRRLSTTLHRREQAFANAMLLACGQEAELGLHATAPEDAATIVERRELGRRIASALAELCQDDRELLVAWARGIPGREIARKRNIPHSTARGRLMRAKGRLAAAYARTYQDTF